eukprot:scaffold179_cov247-Pinguiococcus_pyrenoidosus.AAC.5
MMSRISAATIAALGLVLATAHADKVYLACSDAAHEHDKAWFGMVWDAASQHHGCRQRGVYHPFVRKLDDPGQYRRGVADSKAVPMHVVLLQFVQLL